MSETVVIRVDGVDITTSVLFETASFESQMGAVPGTFEFTVKDDLQTLSFTTGDEITLDVGSRRLYGGYLTFVTQKFAFPVVDTTNVAAVTARQWTLRGVDYNILFDKRILRNLSDLTHHLGTFPAGSMTGQLIRDILIPDFLDVPAGFDGITLVDDVVTGNPDSVGAWKEQGTTWRAQMDDFARWGAVYYINADFRLVYAGVEDTEAKWQFSDKPNLLGIPSGYGYKPTHGFRELESIEDATQIVNDAFVWGGSEWSAGIVFARRQNSASITARGRWQLAETHFGDLKTQAQVNARANVIVDGTVSGTSGSLTRGLVNPSQTVRLVWYDRNVPTDPNLSNAKSYLRPGDLLNFIFYSLGTDVAHPLILTLPLRTQRISFPELDPTGKPHVRFEGVFGLQLSDPWWLWKYLRDRQRQINPILATATDGATDVSYGTLGAFTPEPDTDGVTTLFTIPFGYISGTTEVYLNGIRLFSPVEYSESGPAAGEVTLVNAPAGTDRLYIIARLTGG